MQYTSFDEFITGINAARANGDESRFVVDVGDTVYLIKRGDPLLNTSDVYLGGGDFRGLEHLNLSNVVLTAPTWIARMDQNNTYAVRVMDDFINDKAFKGCTGLTSVLVPDTLRLIGKKAFCMCTQLITINTRYADASVTNGLPAGVMLDRGAFHQSGLTSITMPQGSVFLDGCFSGCRNLVSADVSKCAMTFIPRYAFSECEQLSNVRLQADVRVIRTSAFGSCNLKRLELQSVVRIEDYAFQYNPLRTVTFGRNLATIGNKAFLNCQLQQVYLPRTTYINNDSYGNRSFDAGVNIVRGNVFMQLPNLETPLRIIF